MVKRYESSTGTSLERKRRSISAAGDRMFFREDRLLIPTDRLQRPGDRLQLKMFRLYRL